MHAGCIQNFCKVRVSGDHFSQQVSYVLKCVAMFCDCVIECKPSNNINDLFILFKLHVYLVG